MKNTLYILLILFVVSCTTSKPVYTLSYSFIGYSDFSERDFFITESNSVSFDYTPIGSIVVSVTAGHSQVETEYIEGRDGAGEVTSFKHTTYGDWKEVDISEVLERLYSLSVSKGANGIINLKITYQREIRDATGKDIISPESYTVSGMAIKKIK